MPTLSEALQSNFAMSFKEAWRWWIDELSTLLPRGGFSSFTQGARTSIRLTSTGVEVEHIAQGVGRRFLNDVPVEQFEEQDWDQLVELMRASRAHIVLAPPRVYATRVRLPAAARARLRSAVALQLQSISPLEPDRVDCAMGRPQVDGGQIEVEVLLARRSELDGLQALFENFEVPCQICGMAGEELVTLRSVRGPRRWGLGGQIPRAWLIAAAMVASVPLTAFAGAAMLSWSNSAAVTTLKQEVQPKLALERDLRRKEELRAALAPLAHIATASMLLEDLANRLPHSVHVKSLRYERDGTTELNLIAPDPDIVAGAIELDSLLPNFTQVGQTPAQDNGIVLSYRAGR